MRALTPLVASMAFAAFPFQASAQAVGCTLTVEQDGAIGASVNGETLGSEEMDGRPAILRIQNTFQNTITIAPPTMIESPAAYEESGQMLEVAYAGQGDFAAVDQGYTTATTAFSSNALNNDTITIDAKASPADGEPIVAGSYRLRVVVTCS